MVRKGVKKRRERLGFWSVFLGLILVLGLFLVVLRLRGVDNEGAFPFRYVVVSESLASPRGGKLISLLRVGPAVQL